MGKWIQQNRYIINIVGACLGIGLVIFYNYCGSSCSYLRGGIFGIDLKYAGIAYMVALAAISIFRIDFLILPLLAAGVGSEFFLVGFQMFYDTYCPYCLTFGTLIVLLFLFNLQKKRLIPAAVFLVLGFLMFILFFKGSVAPTFDLGKSNLPISSSSFRG